MPDRSDRRSGEDPTPAPVSEGAPTDAVIAKWGGTSEMHALFLMDAKLCHALEELTRLSEENSRLAAERDAWEAFAEHVAHCVECGELTYEHCSDGNSLYPPTLGDPR